MTQDKHIEYISKGKDPYREEFNKAAKVLDKILKSKSMSLEEKIYAVENVTESMNGKPHKPKKKKENSKQLKLDI